MLMKKMFKSVVCFLLSFCFNFFIQGTDIYVDCQHSGSFLGTKQNPFKKITAAVTAAANGDRIFVASGTYSENVLLDSDDNGISLYGGYNREDWSRNIESNQTIINGGGKDYVYCILLYYSQDIVISGFYLTNAQRLMAVYPAKNVVIENNYFHDAVGTNYTSGINVESVNDYTTENIIIKHNVIWNIIGQYNYRGGGIDVTAHQSKYPTNNIQILHNTIYNVSQDGICTRATINNFIVKNNIVIKARDTGIEVGNSTGVADYNCVYDTPELYYGYLGDSIYLGGANDLQLDPLFENSGSGNFHLRNDSPAIDAGDPTSDSSFETEPNGNRVNMGAYGNTIQATSSFLGSAYWNLDSNLNDSWGTNNGYCENINTTPLQPAEGIRNGGAYFDGNDKLYVINDEVLDWGSNTSFTIDLWIRPDDTVSQDVQIIIGKYKNVSINEKTSWWVGYFPTTGRAVFYLRDANNSSRQLNGSANIDLTDGNWHHLMCVWDEDSNEMRLYVDDEVMTMKIVSFKDNFIGANPINIGHYDNDYFYKGYLDEIRIYNQAISDLD